MRLVEGEGGEGQSVAPLTWDSAAIWRDLLVSNRVFGCQSLRGP